MSPTTTLSTILRRAVYVGAGGTVFGSAVYLAYHAQRMEKAYDERRKLENYDESFSFVKNPKRNEQYERVATCYDDAIGRDEFYMGINLLRRFLVYWYAKGTVLEVGAGTGRNIAYYSSPSVQRVVLVDSSQAMLEQAREKVAARNTTKQQPQYAFLQGDSAHLEQLPDRAFDTVIDTFGLCSYNDPVAVVREMMRLCKPDGTILLLEHGRSKTWDMITRHLDKHAEQHAANWGCVWNRDLDAILSDASSTTAVNPFEIVHLYKFHFGTTYLIVVRPKKNRDDNGTLTRPTLKQQGE
jgi:methyltransferase OMS1, mitochondrial